MFPSAHSVIIRNEAGEPLGWDNPNYYEEEYDPDDYLNYDEEDDLDEEDNDDNLDEEVVCGKHLISGECDESCMTDEDD